MGPVDSKSGLQNLYPPPPPQKKKKKKTLGEGPPLPMAVNFGEWMCQILTTSKELRKYVAKTVQSLPMKTHDEIARGLIGWNTMKSVINCKKIAFLERLIHNYCLTLPNLYCWQEYLILWSEIPIRYQKWKASSRMYTEQWRSMAYRCTSIHMWEVVRFQINANGRVSANMLSFLLKKKHGHKI